jgi:hypothetical protein
MKRTGITRVTIENFKGIRDRVEIPLRPITMLFGPNSAGKSTILQALLYLRELLERQNADADRLLASGAFIDLGGFRQFVHQHDLTRPVRVGVTLEVDEDGLPVYPVPFPLSTEEDAMDDNAARAFFESGLSHISEVSVEVTVQWDEVLSSPWITAYEVGVNGRLFGRIEADSERQAYLTVCEFKHPVISEEFRTEDDEEDELNSVAQAILSTLGARGLVSNVSDGRPLRIPLATRVMPEWGRTLLANPTRIRRLAGRVGRRRRRRLPTCREEDEHQFALAQFVISHLMVGAGEVVLGALRDIRYIGPIRSIPERNFDPLRSPVEDRWADGSAAWDLLFKSAVGLKEERLVEKVSDTLSKPQGLGLGYRVEIQRAYEVPVDSFAIHLLTSLASDSSDYDLEEKARLILDDIRNRPEKVHLALIDEAKDTEVDPCDIGTGVSQVIPVIVGAIDDSSGIIAIEQPELHIHPAVQCALGDVFIRNVNGDADRTFVLETHSEHLLLRMMKRMRQTSTCEISDMKLSLTADQITVLFVEIYDGRSVFREMPLNERGELIKAWPGGFFEEDFEELI